jgi:hypothetical protein
MATFGQQASSLMKWYIRLTRFGTTHLVRLQENQMSCGPNCVMMVHTRMNKVMTVANAMATEHSMLATMQGIIPGYDGTAGTTPADMANLLNGLGIGQWADADVGTTGIAQAAVDSASLFNLSTVPLLAVVAGAGWSHFVLIDYMIKKPFGGGYWAIVADPWDAHVYVITMNTNAAVRYDLVGPSIAWSIPPIPQERLTPCQAQFTGSIVHCTGMDVKSRLGKIFLGAGV